MLLTRTIFSPSLFLFVNGQTESFKLTFNHQALTRKAPKKTGDFYIEILALRKLRLQQVKILQNDG